MAPLEHAINGLDEASLRHRLFDSFPSKLHIV